jgi:hypothetical protein
MPRVEFIQGNDLHLLRSGAEYFPALLQAINEAKMKFFWKPIFFSLMRRIPHSAGADTGCATRCQRAGGD